jgi:hypothetical protein
MLVSHVPSGSAIDLEKFISAPSASSDTYISLLSISLRPRAYATAHAFCCSAGKPVSHVSTIGGNWVIIGVNKIMLSRQDFSFVLLRRNSFYLFNRSFIHA